MPVGEMGKIMTGMHLRKLTCGTVPIKCTQSCVLVAGPYKVTGNNNLLLTNADSKGGYIIGRKGPYNIGESMLRSIYMF